MMKRFFRYFWRDYQSGDLTLLMLCLIIAVAAATSVGFFADRIKLALTQQSHELLAGDLRVYSYRPIPQTWLEHANTSNLTSAFYQTLQSVVVHENQTDFLLAEVKAVDLLYPLRGQLKTKQSLQSDAIVTTEKHGPTQGNAWVDANLFSQLSLAINQTVLIGNTSFKIEKIIDFEPDRGGDIINVAPRIMIHHDDLASTGLILPGSRIRYTMLLTGSPAQLDTFQRLIPVDPDITLQTLSDAQPNLHNALDRAQQFMNLAALVSLILAGCGIALAANTFAVKRTDTVAILRALGANQRQILEMTLSSLLIASFFAALIGSLLGYFIHHGFNYLLISLFLQQALPSPSIMPLLTGLFISFAITLGCAAPRVLALKNISPMRVLRDDAAHLPLHPLHLYLPAMIVCCLLFFIQAKTFKLGFYALLGFITSAGLLWGIAYLMLIALRHWQFHSPQWMGIRLGLQHLIQRRHTSILQIVVIGLSLGVVLLMTVVRDDLLGNWRVHLSQDNANQFMINVPPDAVADIQHWLEANGAQQTDFYPSVRGRISAHNGHVFTGANFTDPDAKRLAQREYNLSWTTQLPASNQLLKGTFPPVDTGISVDQKIMDSFGFELGDEITLSINGQSYTTQISSVRQIDWTNVRVNFFILLPITMLKEMPHTYIGSYYWPETQKSELRTLVKNYPALTLIDVSDITLRLQNLVQRLSLAITYIFGFSVITGILVLLIALQSTHQARMVEIGLYKTFGASQRMIKTILWSEFTLLGLMSGLLAGLCAYLMGVLLMYFVFQFNAFPAITTLIFGITLGIFIVIISAYAGCQRFFKLNPMSILRR